MAEDKQPIPSNGVSLAAANGVATRTSTLRKTSRSHPIINGGNGHNDSTSTTEDGKPSTSGRSATNGVKRGTKRAVDGAVTPTVMDEAAIKRNLRIALESDGEDDENDRDTEGRKIYLAKRDMRRLLRVLTALSLPPVPIDSTAAVPSSGEDSGNIKKKARLLQLILDQAFIDEHNKSSLNGTLREMLSGDDKVKVQDLVSHINMLATALAPTMPLPFPSSLEDERTRPYLNSRLAGSRSKPIKDAALIDAFTTLADVVSTVLSSQKNNDVDYISPNPKIRWALHQRLGAAPSATAKSGKVPMQTSDWFSAATETIDAIPSSKEEENADGDVDMDKVKKEEDEKDEGSLTRLRRERAFGNANVVTLPPPVGNNSKGAQAKAPTLNEILFVHPSRATGKSQWKERRQQVKGNAQNSRTVTYPRCHSTFTPSFAPTHDSSNATNGFAYYPTWEAATGKASVHTWLNSGWNSKYGTDLEIPSEQDITSRIEDFRPRASRDDIENLLKSLVQDESTVEIDPTLIDAVDQTQDDMREMQKRLDQNAVWVKQLQEFQEIRLHRGQRKPLEEEDRIAQRLQQSLVELSSITTPKALLPKDLRETEDPIAIVLARKVIHTSAPSVRGTLDPSRPKALSDNTTISARAPDQIAPPIAKPVPMVSTGPRQGTMTPMRVPSNQQWQTGPQKVIAGTSPQVGPPRYNNPLSMQAGTSRYAFPPESNPGITGRSSPIPPMKGVPSVLRNSLPQAVGIGSFSPVGRSTLTTTSAPFGGQSGRGIGSSMAIQMNASGMNGSPVPAFRPSNTMRN